MEINATGNTALMNRTVSERASGEVENKTGSTDASSVSQQASVEKTSSIVAPPPAPTTEVSSEDNTLPSGENIAGKQVDLTA